MKPRKTRIKVQTLADGTVAHTPQHKGGFNWYDFSDHEGYSRLNHTNPLLHAYNSYSLSAAQDQINSYLRAVAKEEKKRADAKVSKTIYIKYP